MTRKQQFTTSLLATTAFFMAGFLVWVYRTGQLTGSADVLREGEKRVSLNFTGDSLPIVSEDNLTQGAAGLFPKESGKPLIVSDAVSTKDQTGTVPDLKNWSIVKVVDGVESPDTTSTATVQSDGIGQPLFVQLDSDSPSVPISQDGRKESVALTQSLSTLPDSTQYLVEADIKVKTGKGIIGLIGEKENLYSDPVIISSSTKKVTLLWDKTGKPQKVVVGLTGGGGSVDIFSIRVLQPVHADAVTSVIGGTNVNRFTRLLPSETTGAMLPNSSFEKPIGGSEGLSNWVLGSRGQAKPPDSPEILTFSSSSSSITTGENVTLSWTTKNATICKIDGGGIGIEPCNSSKTISPVETGTYLLTATGSDGTTPATKVVTIVVNPVTPGNPEILSLTANNTLINPGEAATLSWSTKNATTCRFDIELGAEQCNSIKDVHPTADATYTLTASGADGTTPTTKTITISVITGPPPPPGTTNEFPPTPNDGTSTESIIFPPSPPSSRANVANAEGTALPAVLPLTTALNRNTSPNLITNGFQSIRFEGNNVAKTTADATLPIDFLYQFASFSPSFDYELTADILVESGEATFGVARQDAIANGLYSQKLSVSDKFQTVKLTLPADKVTELTPNMIIAGTLGGPGTFVIDNITIKTTDKVDSAQTSAYIAYKVKTSPVNAGWDKITASAALRPASPIELNETIAPIGNKYMQVEMIFFGEDPQLVPAVSSLAVDYAEVQAPVQPVVGSITVDPASFTGKVNETKTFKATVKDVNGNVISSGVTIAWKFDAPADSSTVATLSTTNSDTTTITAKKEGQATLTATATGGGSTVEAIIPVTVSNSFECGDCGDGGGSGGDGNGGGDGGGGGVSTVGGSSGSSTPKGSLVSTGGSLVANLAIAALLSGISTWLIYRKKERRGVNFDASA